MECYIMGDGTRLVGEIFQSCVILTKDKRLWIRPFTQNGILKGYTLAEYDINKDKLFEELEKLLCPKKRGRPRKSSKR